MKFSVALLGSEKAVARTHRILTRSGGSQASSLVPVALVVTGDQTVDHDLPVYRDWRSMLDNHTVDILYSFENEQEIKADLRRNLPLEIDLIEYHPGQILNASILNQQVFVKKSENRQQVLESFLEALPVAAVIFDRFGHVLFWNEACSKLTHSPVSRAVPRESKTSPFGSDAPMLGQLILETLDPKSLLTHFEGPDIEINPLHEGVQVLGYFSIYGSLQGYYQIIAQRIFSGDELIGSVQLIQDLTSWHLLQEQLKNQQEQLKTIISHLPFPLIHTDEQGRVLFANQAARQSALFARLKGKDTAEPKNFLLSFPELKREFTPHFLSDITSTPPEFTPHLSKTLNIHLSDQEWAVTCLALPVQGNSWNLIWILNNISSKEEQDRLNAAVAIAGAISHELSQPLTAIINSAQLLGNTGLDDRDRIKRHVQIITAEGERVLGLYQKLHNISRFKLTNYLDMQIFDLEESTDLNLTIPPSTRSEDNGHESD